jgi:hypothetical protein
MQHCKPALSLAVPFLAGVSILCAAAAPAPPSAAKVRQVVADFFANVPGYRDGDLIDRAQVEVLMKQLKAIGYQAPQPEAIVARVPEPDEWLVAELRTPAGRALMRQIARYPGAYDRLDRLSAMPHGKQTIHDLERGPDGYKLLEYLTMAKGGREMGKMLSRTPTGANFNRPTGRIYTADALLRELDKAGQPVKGRGART